MDRRRWVGAAILAALGYLVVGLASASLAGHATSHQMRTTWRLLAWVFSAVIFAAHIWYEFFRLRNSRVGAALHVAAAVALGAFGTAVAANIHAYVVGSTHRVALRISLLAWPVLAGVPAFVVALAATYGLRGARYHATSEAN